MKAESRRRRQSWSTGLALFCALACVGDDNARPPGTLSDVLALRASSDTNLLFILIDTLRADHLGAYGYERETSPVIDGLAASGIRFGRHVSQSSWTKCSMASLWTGLYPNRTGVLHAQHAIPDSALLPAEIFRESGFRTAAIWRNGWIAPNFGFGQGFEIYHSPTAAIPLVVQRRNPERVVSGDGDVIRSANVFVRQHAHERWFLYLHLMDVHQYSYDPDSAVFGSSYLDAYDNAILWTDKLIGYLLEELDQLGIRDETMIVIAADHGEAFGEHGGEGHARNVYAEVTQTPVIISLPFRLEEPIVVDTLTRNVDLWPTVLDLLGLSELEDTDGESQVAAIERAAEKGADASTESTAIAHLDSNWSRDPSEGKPIVALDSGRFRLIWDARVPSRPQLFDKTVDPRELRDVSAREPDRVTALVENVEAYLERQDAPWGEAAPLIEIDDMQLQQLRAIGYGVP